MAQGFASAPEVADASEELVSTWREADKGQVEVPPLRAAREAPRR